MLWLGVVILGEVCCVSGCCGDRSGDGDFGLGGVCVCVSVCVCGLVLALLALALVLVCVLYVSCTRVADEIGVSVFLFNWCVRV